MKNNHIKRGTFSVPFVKMISISIFFLRCDLKVILAQNTFVPPTGIKLSSCFSARENGNVLDNCSTGRIKFKSLEDI